MTARYSIAWLGMMMVAVINGVIRDVAYKPFAGELAAHQISTATLILLFAAYFWWLTGTWKLQSALQAWKVGTIWLVLTEGFEFGLGFSRGDSWDMMLHAYNLFQGQVWIFIPLWVLVGPYVFFRFVRNTSPGNEKGEAGPPP